MSENITRPIVGIENRTAQEVFDIMVARIGAPPPPTHKMAGALRLAREWLPSVEAHIYDSEKFKSDLATIDAVLAGEPAPAELSMGSKFAVGDRVRKRSGSWWEGRIVGFYSTEQTPIGYNVQLDRMLNGPVQIYPETALSLSPTDATQNPLSSTNGEIGETNQAPAEFVVGGEALVREAIEAIWRLSLIIESSVRRGDGPSQYAEVVQALGLVKQARCAFSVSIEMPNSAGSQIRTTQRCGMDVGSDDRTSPVAPPSTITEQAMRLCELLENTFNLSRDIQKSCLALRAALSSPMEGGE